MLDHDRRPFGIRGPAVAPPQQRNDGGEQLEALLGQAVLEADAAARLAVGLLAEDALVDESLEARAEDVARAADCALEVREAPHAVESLAEDEQCPLLADDIERATDRAVLGAVPEALRVHASQRS